MQNRREAIVNQPVLILVAGNHDKKPRSLDREVTTVGRARGADLCLEANDISTLHCIIRWQEFQKRCKAEETHAASADEKSLTSSARSLASLAALEQNIQEKRDPSPSSSKNSCCASSNN